MQRNRQFGQAHVADEQQVDVAVGAVLSSRHRAMDGRVLDTIGQWHDETAQLLSHSERLGNKADQLVMDGCVRIRTVEHQVAALLAQDQASGSQPFRLLADLAAAGTHPLDDFACMEGFPGCPKRSASTRPASC